MFLLLLQVVVGISQFKQIGRDIYWDLRNSFGFESGGQANISLNLIWECGEKVCYIPEHAPVVFGLMTLSDYKNLIITGDLSEYCGSVSNRISNIQMFGQWEDTFLEAVIDTTDILVPFYLPCRETGDPPGELTVNTTYSFRNPTGWLDYRWKASKICFPILIGIYGAMLVGWLIHRRVYGSPKIIVHNLITLGLFAGLTTQFTLYVTILKRDVKGYPEYADRQDDLGFFGILWIIVYNLIITLLLRTNPSTWSVFSTDSFMSNGWYTNWFFISFTLLIVAYGLWFFVSLLRAVGGVSQVRAVLRVLGLESRFIYSHGLMISLFSNLVPWICSLVSLIFRMHTCDDGPSYLMNVRDVAFKRRCKLVKLLNVGSTCYVYIQIVHICMKIYDVKTSNKLIHYNWLISGFIDGVFWGFIVYIFHLNNNYPVDYIVDNEPQDASDSAIETPLQDAPSELEDCSCVVSFE